MNRKIKMEATKYGFKKGFENLKSNEQLKTQLEIMKILGVKSAMSWHNYLNGRTIMKADKKEAIEKLFHKKGVTEIFGK